MVTDVKVEIRIKNQAKRNFSFVEKIIFLWRERYMKCPYCDEEMEDGILQAQRLIIFPL